MAWRRLEGMVARAPARRKWRAAFTPKGFLLLIALVAVPTAAAAADPMAVMRAFCRADGDGARLRVHSWKRIGALVDWQLEPAWDHVFVISGYQLSTPRGTADRVEMDVEYTVTAEIFPGLIRSVQRVDAYTYTLVRDPRDSSWRILGPPSAPHLFESRVDRQAMATLLDPESETYESASALVWRTLRKRGAGLAYADLFALSRTAELEDVATGERGDVVLYYDGATPYHTGILGDDETVLSSTLNAGVRHLPVQAFPGEIRYRRVFSGFQVPAVEAD